MTEAADAQHRHPVPGHRTVRRSALYVVTPAHPMGAASANDSPSGIRASAVAGAVTDSA